MIEFRYDTQLLIEGKNLSEEAINEYFNTHFKGDCLLAVGDDTLMNHGKFWNTALALVKFMISLLKTWIDKQED